MARLLWIRRFLFQPYANLANVSLSFLAEQIISLNGFGCPISSRTSYIRCISNEEKHESASEKFDSCGLWPIASYINHSCYSNARRSFTGDMMIVRASRDLAPNTEIVFWYKSPFGDSEQQVKWQYWGYKCTCVMCQDIQATDRITLAKGKRLRPEILRTFQSHKQLNAPKIEILFSTLRETYTLPATKVPRLALWDLHLSLSEIYTQPNQAQNAIV